MSAFESCRRCGALVWVGRETCPCEPYTYRLMSWDEQDDWRTGYYRGGAEQAAASIVEHDWESEPYDPHKVDETVIFKDDRGCQGRYHVTAEATVDFHAQEVPHEP
jgi:hypothetical protein